MECSAKSKFGKVQAYRLDATIFDRMLLFLPSPSLPKQATGNTAG